MVKVRNRVKLINHSLITALPVATSAQPQSAFYPQPKKPSLLREKSILLADPNHLVLLYIT